MERRGALPNHLTFYGWNNIQTLNVNSGTWTLIGGGFYNTVSIASGAAFNVCVDGATAACGSTYNGSHGTVFNVLIPCSPNFATRAAQASS